MRVGNSSTLILALSLVACERDHATRIFAPFDQLETSLEAQLTKRVGVPIVVRCPTPIACVGLGPDNARIPIVLTPAKPEWAWKVDGLLVISDALETYLELAVAELGAAQDVRCAPRIRVLAANDRIDCWLANGGKAFVTVAATGETSVEIELAKVAADARSEVRSVKDTDSLSQLSNALEHANDSDGEEATLPPDGGTLPAP